MTRSYIKTDSKVKSCKTSHHQDPYNFNFSNNSSAAFNLQTFDDKKKVNRKKEQNSYRNNMKNTMQSFERIEEIVSQGVDQCMSKKKSSRGLAPHHHRKATDEDVNLHMYKHVVVDAVRQKEPIMTHNLQLKRELKENVDYELDQLKKALEEKQNQEFLDKYLEKRSKKSANKLKKKMEREGEDFKNNIIEREENAFTRENFKTAEDRVEETYNKLKSSYINSLTTEEKIALKELEKYDQTESPFVFKHFRKTKAK